MVMTCSVICISASEVPSTGSGTLRPTAVSHSERKEDDRTALDLGYAVKVGMVHLLRERREGDQKRS